MILSAKWNGPYMIEAVHDEDFKCVTFTIQDDVNESGIMLTEQQAIEFAQRILDGLDK